MEKLIRDYSSVGSFSLMMGSVGVVAGSVGLFFVGRKITYGMGAMGSLLASTFSTKLGCHEATIAHYHKKYDFYNHKVKENLSRDLLVGMLNTLEGVCMIGLASHVVQPNCLRWPEQYSRCVKLSSALCYDGKSDLTKDKIFERESETSSKCFGNSHKILAENQEEITCKNGEKYIADFSKIDTTGPSINLDTLKGTAMTIHRKGRIYDGDWGITSSKVVSRPDDKGCVYTGTLPQTALFKDLEFLDGTLSCNDGSKVEYKGGHKQ